jgi:imidazoleglycerol phosphate synthase glutamine amidotransferase subunit HisH
MVLPGVGVGDDRELKRHELVQPIRTRSRPAVLGIAHRSLVDGYEGESSKGWASRVVRFDLPRFQVPHMG